MAMLPYILARLSLLFAWAAAYVLAAGAVLAAWVNLPQLTVLAAAVAYLVRRRRASL